MEEIFITHEEIIVDDDLVRVVVYYNNGCIEVRTLDDKATKRRFIIDDFLNDDY